MTNSNCRGTLLVAILITAVFRGSFGQDVTFGDMSEGTVSISFSKEKITARLLMRQVKLPKPGAFSGFGFVSVVYEPASHLFWWTFQHTNGPANVDSEKLRFIKSYSFGMDRSRIIAFNGFGRSVWVRESSAEASSVTRAFESIDHNLNEEADQISSGVKVWSHQFNLSQVLGSMFFSSKKVQDVGGLATGGLQVKSVARCGNDWRVEVVNDYGDVESVAFNDSLTAVHKDSGR